MTERSSAVTAEMWLIVKRDLYFRPGCLGYTGIKDEAGRYPYEFAKDYDSGECRIVREIDAPEFTGAAYHDLVIKHLQRQRDGLRAEIERLSAPAQGLSDLDTANDEAMARNVREAAAQIAERNGWEATAAQIRALAVPSPKCGGDHAR